MHMDCLHPHFHLHQGKRSYACLCLCVGAPAMAMLQAMRDIMEENYRRWHVVNEERLQADVVATEDKAEAAAKAARDR
jgi:hypothetical protein